MTVVVKISKDLAKLTNSPVAIPLENVDKRFAKISEVMKNHGASYMTGFGAAAHVLRVNTTQVKDASALVNDLLKLDGVEEAYVKQPVNRSKPNFKGPGR